MAANAHQRRLAIQRRQRALDLGIACLLTVVVNVGIWVALAPKATKPRVWPDMTKLLDQVSHKKTSLSSGQLQLGKDNATTPSVAWISYDSFKKLEAKKSKTQQPALQNKVTPVKHALPRLNPTPPAPNEKATRSHAVPMKIPALTPEQSSASAMKGLDEKPVDAGDVPFAKVSKRPGQSSSSQAKAKSGKAKSQVKKSTKAAAAGGAIQSKARPTSAAKSPSESSLANFIEHTHPIEPGQVLVGPGIEVQTKVPDFSAVTLASSLPLNPEANITFNARGRVIDVQITRSSSFPNVDSSIEQCLYRWRAKGKKLKQLNGPFTLHMTILLMPE